MNTWKLEITLKVADSWVADGFNAENRIDQIKELLTELLPYSLEEEFTIDVKVTQAPKPEVIKGLQNGDIDGKD